MNTKRIYQLLPAVVILISIESVSNYTNLRSTTVWWILNAFILYFFYTGKRIFISEVDNSSRRILFLYLIWNFFSVLRGFFIAETYWDWKQLIDNTLSLFIPISVFHSVDPEFTGTFIKKYLKYCLPLFIVVFLMIQRAAYGFYLIPAGFLFLFLPILPGRWRFIIPAICVIILYMDQTNRSNIIKFGLPGLLMLFYFSRKFFTVAVLNFVFLVVMLLPFLFSVLAVNGEFNVFKMEEYLSGDFGQETRNAKGEIIVEDLRADTRTQLYTDVQETAKKYDSWIAGRSPARGNETTKFSDIAIITGREERSGNEVAILNIFTWTGGIGVVLYFFIFFWAAFLSINKSNNYFIKIVGIFLAFRWSYSWIEDINNFTLNYFLIWFMIAMCLSNSFREMDNQEFTEWLSDCF